MSNVPDRPDQGDARKKILLAAPRGWCAGVGRAVEVVERLLRHHGPPVYVRKQIVHNLQVVRELERKGVVFVESEEDVPPGSICVLSAHGVAPAVRENARRRALQVVDATCPLVAKVHTEARRLARAGKTIFLIGHASHEEIEGTSGEAPDAIEVIEGPEDAERASAPDPSAVAYLTQTTLAVDDTAEIIEALRQRFPAITGPRRDDICYASQSRQLAVKALAARSDVVLVVGSENSSNANRLVEVAHAAGARSWLIEDETCVDSSWFAGAEVIGLSSGASTPEVLVERVISFLKDCGYEQVEEVRVADDEVRFPLPPSLDRAEGGVRTIKVHRKALHLRTAGEFDVIDVTGDVEKAVVNAEIEEGYALVYSRHTTFAILLNEKESGLLVDTRRVLRTLVPESNGYLHDDFDLRTENLHPDEPPNAHAHLRQILAGRNSEYIPVAEGSLMLGTWQRIMLVEFDRARDREVLIQVCGI